MQYNYEKAEKSQVKLTIKFDENDWEQAIRKAYEKNKGKTSQTIQKQPKKC